TDHGAARITQTDRLGHIGGNLADLDADAAAGNLAMLFELFHDPHHFVDGDSQRNAHEAAALRNDLRVDADHFPGQIDERAAGVAGVDRDVGLDKGQVIARLAVDGADDARGYGRIQAERRADGQYPLAFLELLGVADGQGRQPLDVDLD